MLGCICLRLSTANEVNRSLETSRKAKTGKKLRVGKWLGVKLFDSTEVTINVVCSSPGLELFTKSSHWSHQRFYVERLKIHFQG